ncbi:MAG: hypothetical protein ACK53L_22685, partial [Pirellulaceae bacterium]
LTRPIIRLDNQGTMDAWGAGTLESYRRIDIAGDGSTILAAEKSSPGGGKENVDRPTGCCLQSD